MNRKEIDYLINNEIYSISGIYNVMLSSNDITENSRYLKKLVDNSTELMNMLSAYSLDEIYYHLKTNKELGFYTCPICGKNRMFSKHNRCYNETCGEISCIRKSTMNNYEKTCMEMYGVKNGGGSIQSVEKIKNTKYERYGDPGYHNIEKMMNTIKEKESEDSMYWEKRRKKAEETSLRLYGDRYYHNIEQIKKTNQQRYGKNTKLATKEFKEYLRKKTLEKYGVEYFNQIPEQREKMRDMMLKRYSDARRSGRMPEYMTYISSQENKDRVRIVNMTNCYYRLTDTHAPVVLLNDLNYYLSKNADTIFDWKCNRCGNVFKSKIDKNWNFKGQDNMFARCRKCYPFLCGNSNGEKQIVEYIKSIYDGEIVNGSFKIIKPYQIDIYLPDIKLGIEYNGVYYHSEEYLKTIEIKHIRPIEKTIMCEEMGINLLHIWEDDWMKQQEMEKQKIFNILNHKNMFDTHDDELKIDRSIYNKSYHINGYILEDEIQPNIVRRFLTDKQIFSCYDCGILLYRRI